MKKQIDLYLITGFLGAGKTTVLKEILKQAPDKKIGIIMNEFGKVGIDGGLVDDRAAELVEINRGSIFCDCLKLTFIESLKEMAGKEIDYLFVEGSGLADPSNIGEILDAAEVLVGDIYSYKGSLCVVDGPHFIEQSIDIEAMNRQVKYSHLAIISKSDITDEEMLKEVENKVFEFNKEIRVARAEMGRLSFDVFKEDLVRNRPIMSDDTTNKKENKPKTLTLNIFGEVEKEKLEIFLKALSKEAYRMKGFINLVGEGTKQIDVVNGRIDYKDADSSKETQLVILSKVGPGIIRSIVSVWEKEVGVEYKLKN